MNEKNKAKTSIPKHGICITVHLMLKKLVKIFCGKAGYVQEIGVHLIFFLQKLTNRSHRDKAKIESIKVLPSFPSTKQ